MILRMPQRFGIIKRMPRAENEYKKIGIINSIFIPVLSLSRNDEGVSMALVGVFQYRILNLARWMCTLVKNALRACMRQVQRWKFQLICRLLSMNFFDRIKYKALKFTCTGRFGISLATFYLVVKHSISQWLYSHSVSALLPSFFLLRKLRLCFARHPIFCTNRSSHKILAYAMWKPQWVLFRVIHELTEFTRLTVSHRIDTQIYQWCIKSIRTPNCHATKGENNLDEQ